MSYEKADLHVAVVEAEHERHEPDDGGGGLAAAQTKGKNEVTVEVVNLQYSR